MVAVIGANAPIAGAADQTPNPDSESETTAKEGSDRQKPRAIWLSPDLAEVLRLVKNNVDDQVIKAYIRHSPSLEPPTAGELVALKEAGVADEILAALVEHAAPVQSPPPPGPAAPSAAEADQPAAAPAPYPAYPAVGYPYPYALVPFITGPMVSFNNSFPTRVNGSLVYSGYYVAGYGYLW